MTLEEELLDLLELIKKHDEALENLGESANVGVRAVMTQLRSEICMKLQMLSWQKYKEEHNIG